ncbi:protein of unknown function [Micropruina glycogenica]|uniref:Response regulatory domain-containing protein n=1 Tax=Micropruina glycogenica TaxID=75385 RepID=A0A2N9JAP3_9ACTN|nr:protein of unknown function [Micropruina glycogenica]
MRCRDYMAKPFSFEELLARVRLRLRSDSNAGAAASTLSHGGLSLDLRTRRGWAIVRSTCRPARSPRPKPF